MSGHFDWSEDVENFEAEQRNKLPPAPSVSSDPARRPPYDPEGPIEPSREYDYNEEDKPRHSRAAALADIYDGDDDDDDYSLPNAASVRSGGGGTRALRHDHPDYNPWNAPADEEVAPMTDDQSQDGGESNEWVDYTRPRQEKPTKVQKRGEWTCSKHGPLCNPGICKERARFERDTRMREEREGWEKERKEREFRRAKDQQKKERKKAEATGERPRSGSSSSSNSGSGSESDTSREGIVSLNCSRMCRPDRVCA